jgi:prephenate dehydrogenase
VSLNFSSACVIGVGLIGGSIALALREKGIVNRVVGVGRGKQNLEDAMRLGIIDRFTHDPCEACQGADLVILATPVSAIPSIVSKIKDKLSPGTLLTDVASTKAKLIQALDPLIPESVDFVPAHPIAGKEKSGCRFSQADLFNNHWTILTPNQRTRASALEKVKSMWMNMGARVEIMDPLQHDRVLAAVSHLPHLVAYALVDTLSGIDQKEPVLRFSAGGFQDFMRVAGSSPEMWRDIFLENQGPIREMIELYLNRLKGLGALIESGDDEGLLRLFVKAREIKEAIEE